MPYQSSFARILLAASLFLGSIVSSSAATETEGATPPIPPKHDFAVALATKDQTHPHFGEGCPVAFTVNGVQGRTLVLTRGKTYTFDVDSNPMHDLYLTTDPAGWGVGTMTEGVKGNFIYKGVITFKPTSATPDVVYYQCRNHKYMGGKIHVVNPGEEDKIKIEEPVAKIASAQPVVSKLDKNEVGQRLNFVEMFTGKSDAAKRIAASSNEEAKGKYKGAQGKLAEARSAFDSGNLQEAKTRADEAMAMMNEAARLVPSESMRKMSKARNDELAQGLITMDASYKQNYDAIAREDGAKDIPKPDSDRIHKLMDAAKAFSEKGNYEEANKILSDTMNELSVALNKMLANRAISYETKFSSPAQEYEHELSHFTVLLDAIQQAITETPPPQATINMMNYYLTKGKESRDLAGVDAKQQDFAAALENIRKGAGQLEAAVKLLNPH